MIRRLTLMLSLALIMQAVPARDTNPQYPPLFSVSLEQAFPEPVSSFDEVRQLILDKYYSPTITEDALYYAAIKGMLAHISPPSNREQASLWPPEQYQNVRDRLKGEQVSLGIKSQFNSKDGSVTVTEVLPHSPADGILEVSDRIMRINGESLKGQHVNAVNSLLNGSVDSEVELVVVRDIEVLTLKLNRHRFDIENLKVTALPGNIGLIEILKVDRDMSASLREALGKAPLLDAEGLIIDLRNNTGGVFAEGLRMAELFLPERHVVLRIVRRPEKLQNYVSSSRQPIDTRLAVLVNKKTASSAEILASSLQAHGRASLVGTSTYGKATLEETFTLKNNYRVKFIIGAMYDPRGRSWQDRGLTPDYYIHQQVNNLPALARLPAEKRLNSDQQLKAAWKLLHDEALNVEPH